MRVAIADFDGRVSPVFDVARHLRVLDVDSGETVAREDVALTEVHELSRVARLKDLGVDVLICGAVSRPLEAALTSAGMRVIARICGPVEDVVSAYLQGRLLSDAFLMPGASRHRRRARQGYGPDSGH
ncbi:MAG: NifB/NifX family molybdenum-iron cluster-binding protein [Phycisphaerae bacterium]